MRRLTSLRWGPRASRSFVEGEQLVPTDLVIEQIDTPPSEPERFIWGTWNGEAWVLVVQLNRPHPQRAAHLEVGLEFAELAEVALDAVMLRSFHEKAFHAAAHLARAELLSYAAALPAIADSRRHGRLGGTYQLWAHLGNTEPKIARLLDDST